MFDRLRNLGAATSDAIGSAGTLGVSIASFSGVVGVYLSYDRSSAVSLIAASTLACTVTLVLFILISAVSKGENRQERSKAVKSIAPLTSVLLNTGFVISMGGYLAGDQVISYFQTNPEMAGVAVLTVAATSICLYTALLSWCLERVRNLEAGSVNPTRRLDRVEETTARVPSIALRYSTKDRKRRAAHFGGRVLCFASSPYLDDDFDFEVNGEFSQIVYRGDHEFHDEGYLTWMLFQLLCAEQSEVAFASSTSKISWEHYGDIEHYAIEILCSQNSSFQAMKNPQNEAEVEWRTNKIRMFLKETHFQVHSFLRDNQEVLRTIVGASMSGSLTNLELRSLLRQVNPANLPAHWDEDWATRSHLRIVK